MIDHVLNMMSERQALGQNAHVVSKIGIITSYNPNNYSVKAKVMPEEAMTGDLPYASAWVGNGWGLFTPPIIGAQCIIICIDGSYNHGVVMGFTFNDEERPLAVPSGEFWLVHEKGSFIKLTNDGKLAINGNVEIDVTTPKLAINIAGDVTLSATGKVTATATEFDLTGDTKITGNLAVSGDITDLNGTKGSFEDFRTKYNEHKHPGIQSGPDSTGTTDKPI